MSLPLDRILAEIETLAQNGVSFHWLHPESKRPIGDNWSEKPFRDLETLKKTHRAGNNIGVRLGEFSKTPWGFLHLLDVDVRDAKYLPEVLAWLKEHWPDAMMFPMVRSGSGGASMHIYFFCPVAFRSKKLAKSKGFTMVWNAEKGREVKKNDWEIELFGTGKQVVVPPSIHPDTKKPYVWERRIDTDDLDLGIGIVSAATVESWGGRQDAAGADEFEDDADWLLAEVKGEPIGLSEAEILKIVGDLPEDWVDDRDGWYQTGMALHHEFRGAKRGFEIWCEWSQQSEKYDEKDQKRVWKSFGKSNRTNPVRMPTLIQAAKAAKFEREFGDILGDDAEDPFTAQAAVGTEIDLLGESDDDDLDLLGPQDGGELDLLGGSDDGKIAAEVAPWNQRLDLNDEAQPKSNLPNIQLIVANDPRTKGIVGFNEFTARLTITQTPRFWTPRNPGPKGTVQLDSPIWVVSDPVNGRGWTDSHENSLRMLLETPRRQGGWGLKVTDRDLRSAVDNTAQLNTYHPVRQKLKQLHGQWDGVRGRVETVFVRYLGCPDTPYHRQASLLTFLGAVTRIFEPGHKFDFVPILEGGQGKRKSTFVAILGMGWTGELSSEFHDDKKMVESTLGHWIMEIPELNGFTRADANALKSWASKVNDRVRLSYERHTKDFPRQFICIGSTNETQYLRDMTGGRRWWPIKVLVEGTIDTDALREEIEQLWGEAVQLYREMRAEQPTGTLPLYLTDEAARVEAEEAQEAARQDTVEEQLAGEIEVWLNLPIDPEFEELDGTPPRYRDQVCIREVWVDLLRREVSALQTRDSNMIAAALNLLPGWEKAKGPRRVHRFGNQRVWRRLSAPPSHVVASSSAPSVTDEAELEDLLG